METPRGLPYPRIKRMGGGHDPLTKSNKTYDSYPVNVIQQGKLLLIHILCVLHIMIALHFDGS